MLNGFKAEKGVSLIAAKIGRDLDCRGGQFIGTSKAPALDTSKAEIGGNLECPGCQFMGNDTALAFDADGAAFKGSVLLTTGFKAAGGVRLVAATIERNLECGGGQFVGNDKAVALGLNGAVVKGNVFLTAGFKPMEESILCSHKSEKILTAVVVGSSATLKLQLSMQAPLKSKVLLALTPDSRRKEK